MKLEERLHHVLGLKKNESKIYKTLLKQGEQDVRNLQTLTKIPQSRIYEVLKDLEIKGLVQAKKKGNQPKSYIALDPSISLSSLISTEKRRYTDRISKLEQLSDYLHDVWKESLDTDLGGSLMTLKFEEAEALLLEDISIMEQRIFIAVSSKRSIIDWKRSASRLREILFKDLDIRYLLQDSTITENLRKRFKAIFPDSDKIKIKSNSDLKMSFIIVDSCVYIILFGETATFDAKVIRSTNSQLVNQFEWIFTQLWDVN
ncbi:MAG: TrmB family transcriptional regulator [Methanobacteriota archaeon]|nr:MAG: TrmB family transcriptional regulator [Euryarchaeota archaeon]